MGQPNGRRFGIVGRRPNPSGVVSLFTPCNELRGVISMSELAHPAAKQLILAIDKTPNSPADKKERSVCPQLSAIVVNVSTEKMCSRRI